MKYYPVDEYLDHHKRLPWPLDSTVHHIRTEAWTAKEEVARFNTLLADKFFLRHGNVRLADIQA